MAIFQDSKVFCNSFIVKIVFKYMCLANPILFFMINLVFEMVEYFNEGQCNEIKLSAFIYNNLSWQQNKICWCTYIKHFLTFQESKKAFSFIDVRTNLNILIRDLLKNWYSAYNNTICPFKLPKFVQHPLESLYFEEWLGISLYKSTSLSVSEWVWLLWNGKPQWPEILRDDYPCMQNNLG